MKVWIEIDRVPKWFGLSTRTLYVVCTDYMRWPHYSRDEAELAAATMRMYLR